MTWVLFVGMGRLHTGIGARILSRDTSGPSFFAAVGSDLPWANGVRSFVLVCSRSCPNHIFRFTAAVAVTAPTGIAASHIGVNVYHYCDYNCDYLVRVVQELGWF